MLASLTEQLGAHFPVPPPGPQGRPRPPGGEPPGSRSGRSGRTIHLVTPEVATTANAAVHAQTPAAAAAAVATQTSAPSSAAAAVQVSPPATTAVATQTSCLGDLPSSGTQTELPVGTPAASQTEGAGAEPAARSAVPTQTEAAESREAGAQTQSPPTAAGAAAHAPALMELYDLPTPHAMRGRDAEAEDVAPVQAAGSLRKAGKELPAPVRMLPDLPAAAGERESTVPLRTTGSLPKEQSAASIPDTDDDCFTNSTATATSAMHPLMGISGSVHRIKDLKVTSGLFQIVPPLTEQDGCVVHSGGAPEAGQSSNLSDCSAATGRDVQWSAKIWAMLPSENKSRLWKCIGEAALSLAMHLASAEAAASRSRALKDLARQWAQIYAKERCSKGVAVPEKEAPKSVRFAEGVLEAEAVTNRVPTKVQFYPPTAPPPSDVWEVVRGTDKWTDMYGPLWREDTVADLCADSELVHREHSDGAPAEQVAPVFVYTAELHTRVVWALWNDSGASQGWKVLQQQQAEDCEQHWAKADAAEVDSAQKMLQLPHSFCRSLGLDTPKGAAFAPCSPPTAALWGVRAFAANDAQGERRYLARYTNLARGQRAISPLHDTGLWLADPEEAFADGPFAVDSLPPSGVLEYLLARNVDEHLSGPTWSAVPLRGSGFRDLIALCEAKANQQKYDAELFVLATMLLDDAPQVRSQRSSLPGLAALEASGWGTRSPLMPVVEGPIRRFSSFRAHIRKLSHSAKQRFSVGAASAHAKSVDETSELSLTPDSFPVAREVFSAKTPVRDGRTRPTPLEIAHGLALQSVQYGGREYIAALSAGAAEPRVVGEVSTRRVCCLQQMNVPFSYQPYLMLNNAMRAQQLGQLAPALTLEVGSAVPAGIAGRYVAAAGTWEQREPHRIIFERAGGPASAVASLMGGHWAVQRSASSDSHPDGALIGAAAPANLTLSRSAVTVSLNGWLLNAVGPLLQLLDKALGGKANPSLESAARGTLVRLGVRRQKNYRGISGVELPPDLYSEGSVVRWAAFSSASEDQGVAASFAQGDGATAVFTIHGHTCISIAPWSRFARERECLYLPNTLFHIIHCLSVEQQQILGKEGLQLFELMEISEKDAQCLMVHRMLRKVQSRGAANVVLQAEEALRTDGVLDMSLSSASDGAVPPGWQYLVRVPEDSQPFCPVAASPDWRQVHCPAAAAYILAQASQLVPVPNPISVDLPVPLGNDTSQLDPYRRVYHCSDEDYILEARLQLFGDSKAPQGPRRVPAVGGDAGYHMVHQVGRLLGVVRWAICTDREYHTWSSFGKLEQSVGEGCDPLFARRSSTTVHTEPDDAEMNLLRTFSAAKASGMRKRPKQAKGKVVPALQVDFEQEAVGHIDSTTGWVAEKADPSPWYQIALTVDGLIGGIVLKGVADSNCWIEKFQVQHSSNGRDWTDTQGKRTFPGCQDADSQRQVLFQPPVLARMLRVIPLRWHGRAPGLRVALLIESWDGDRFSDCFLYCLPSDHDMASGIVTRAAVHLHGVYDMQSTSAGADQLAAMKRISTYKEHEAHRSSGLSTGSGQWRPPNAETRNSRSSSGSQYLGMSHRHSSHSIDQGHWAFAAELRYRRMRPGLAFGLEGVDVLADIIRIGVPLRHLGMRNNRVRLFGMVLLLEAIRSNPHITDVDLDDSTDVFDGVDCPSWSPRGLMASGSTADPLAGLGQHGPDWTQPDVGCFVGGWAALRRLLGSACANGEEYHIVRSAIMLRGRRNRGQLDAWQLLALGPVCAQVVALALYDHPDVLSSLPLRALRSGTVPGTFDLLLRGLALRCRRAQLPPPRHLLHTAAAFGRVKLVKSLLEEFAVDLNERDAQGACALHRAARHANFDVPTDGEGGDAGAVIRALATPAALAVRDCKGRTALFHAVYCHRVHTLQRLVDLRADVDACDAYGNSPLGFATRAGFVDIAAILVKAGANPRARVSASSTSQSLRGALPRAAASGELHVDHVSARSVLLHFRREAFRAKARSEALGEKMGLGCPERAAGFAEQARAAEVLSAMWLVAASRRRVRQRAQSSFYSSAKPHLRENDSYVTDSTAVVGVQGLGTPQQGPL
eukprot:TRINITY_DN5803_c0_g1_i1.p1 TRINITY_DN5803_c0_g1~~TRINITY_DN5803_c0_g1_i1.p1  ORF type:complete len:2168 (+),score=401.78 TRINITY_DN5803_c0_g1_i1:262-6504(+)